MNDENSEINPGAVSLYGADGTEDFPVLKAFQQYIDAEQAKARKRMVTMAIVFGVLTLLVIAVFVSLLIHATERNQALNDRLLEYVIKDRERFTQAPAQDNAAVLAMNAKLEELQRNMTESQHKAEKAELERKAAADQEKIRVEAAEEAKKLAQKAVDEAKAEMAQMKEQLERARQETEQKAEADKPKSPSPAELEVQRLNALLALEKQKASAEAAKRREAELEAYRRAHYPEFYAKKERKAEKPLLSQDDIDSEEPLTYYEETPVKKPAKSVKRAQPAKPAQAPKPMTQTAPAKTEPAAAPAATNPLLKTQDPKKSSTSDEPKSSFDWDIPE